MIPMVKSFFMDETAFIRFSRAGLALFGMALHDGAIPFLNGAGAWWVGPLVTAAALALGAGEKNSANGK